MTTRPRGIWLRGIEAADVADNLHPATVQMLNLVHATDALARCAVVSALLERLETIKEDNALPAVETAGRSPTSPAPWRVAASRPSVGPRTHRDRAPSRPAVGRWLRSSQRHGPRARRAGWRERHIGPDVTLQQPGSGGSICLPVVWIGLPCRLSR
jgi:hypothetical protein